MNGLSISFKGRDGWGWGANGGLIGEMAARYPHPPPALPLEGGGVDAYGIRAIALPTKQEYDVMPAQAAIQEVQHTGARPSPG